MYINNNIICYIGYINLLFYGFIDKYMDVGVLFIKVLIVKIFFFFYKWINIKFSI